MKRGKAANRLIDFYLGIPVLNLLACFRSPREFPRDPKRIGILLNPALGDTLLASAAVQDIRGIWPGAKLILFADAPNLAAAELLPSIDEIEKLPITHPLEAVRVLRRNRLDLLLDFTAWQRITALFTLMSGASFTVGYTRKKQHRHRGYDQCAEHLGDCHELENLRRFTRSLGARTDFPPRLVIPHGPLPEVVSKAGKLVVFHAWASGARSWLREWPDACWAALARSLSTPDRTFLLTGSAADSARCYSLRQAMRADGTRVEVLIGQDGIAGVARVLKQAELLVSVNTGIMHLGAILGVPTVSLDGPTASHRWGPIGPHVASVRPGDGSGGFLDLGFEYRGHLENVMNKISVDAVLQAVEAVCDPKQQPTGSRNNSVVAQRTCAAVSSSG